MERRTLVVSVGRPAHEPGNPVNTPIGTSATFHGGATPIYLRQSSNDSVRDFEAVVGELEGGRGLAFGSGMAAIAAVVDSLPLGAIVVAPRMCYSGTSSILSQADQDGRLSVRWVEISDTDAVLEALTAETAPTLLWVETPTNPLFGVADLPVLTAAAHRVGALVVVDSTWNSPILLRPLEHGADVVMHSATKYIGGHSDLLMGVLVTARDDLWDRFKNRRDLGGAVPGMLECFLALRGIRTLDVRMQRAQSNAGELARRLDAHPKVARVLYPGLPTDPWHERVATLHDGFGAMLCFLVEGGEVEADRLCASVRLISHGTSLGGVESLIERRARYAVDAANGTPDNLIRFSVGIEDVDDLWADLAQAFG